MNRTREDFCRRLLDDDSPQYTLDPERLAARFVRYFRVSGRPTMPELTGLLEEAGFGTVEGRRLDSMKGVHVSAPGGVPERCGARLQPARQAYRQRYDRGLQRQASG